MHYIGLLFFFCSHHTNYNTGFWVEILKIRNQINMPLILIKPHII